MTNTKTTTTTKTTPYFRTLVTLAVLALVASLLVAYATRPAHAASNTYTVTRIDDRPDAKPGDGICSLSTSATFCTLRAAIQEANATPGADAIGFNINAAGGVATIAPNSPLPEIIDQVTINGYSQPGAKENTLAQGTDAQPKIELSGTNAGSADGLVFDSFLGTRKASGSVVRGLVVNRFSRSGIVVRDVDNVRIEGNFVGTDPSGILDRGNGGDGVEILNGATFNTVGGLNTSTNPAVRNLVSGNDLDGVRIHGLTSVGLKTTRNEVYGNLIGTKKDGVGPLGNAGSGVSILGSSSNRFGRQGQSASNTIAFSGQNGVSVAPESGDPATGNNIGANSLFSNAGLGIDLIQGANAQQNKPVITSAKNGGGKTTVKGTLSSLPNSFYVLFFYSNPSGTDEGKVFLGVHGVTTDASGNAAFAFQPLSKVARDRTITATVTSNASSNTDANSSELSAPRTVK
jgi:CSLREA domain-containing protein